MIDPEMLEIFVEESKEHLDHLEPDLLSLESTPEDAEVINRIFRAVHSIKGTSGFFGLDNISNLGHAMESLMSLVRDRKIQINQAMLDALLAGTDKLRVMVEDPAGSASVSIAKEITALEPFLPETTQTFGGTPKKDVPDFSEEKKEDLAKDIPEHLRKFTLEPTVFGDVLEKGQNVYVLSLYLQQDIQAKKLTPLSIFEEIDSLGEIIDSTTDFSEIKSLDDIVSSDAMFSCIFSTIMEPDLIAGAFEIPYEQIVEIDAPTIDKLSKLPTTYTPASEVVFAHEEECTPVVEEETMVAAPSPVETKTTPVVTEESFPEASAAPTAKKSDETIRVSLPLLDDLMNLAGEMVLARNQLLRLGSQLTKESPNLNSVLQNINHITSDLQEKVMRTRLQPVGNIFTKFNRIVRDLGKKLEKEIDLTISGEDVELDKSILEVLSDPLTHIIRNCADHAIETPSEREAAGKKRRGHVLLQASHVGGQVLIEIADDGRGIDPKKIVAKAIEKNVISPEEAKELSEKQALLLIFKPGFSSAEKVSDVSGRGVGMDVVKTNIEKVGGSVEIESVVKRGTKIYLKLPLTLAIVPSMIIGSGGRTFAIPQENLEEIVNIGEKVKIEKVRESEVIRLREKLLPIVRLNKLLGLPEKTEEKTRFPNQVEGFVMVLKIGENSFGLLVDQLLESEEIVVKPLSEYLQNEPCYSGATIMGDGRVAMILDVTGIATVAELDFNQNNALEEDLVKNVNDQSERQSILLFANSTTEQFAINLQMVSRIEKVTAEQINHIGGQHFLTYQDSSLRVIHLHEHINTTPPASTPKQLYVIIPKLVTHPIGIIAHEIIDTMSINSELDKNSFAEGKGTIGTIVINKRMTIFVDIYSLFEIVAPEIYKRRNQATDIANKRVLLAEDTAFFREVETRYLSSIFHSVDVVNHGQDAWKRLQKKEYDLLITDIEMPLMNGFQLAKNIREDARYDRMPIIALTSLSSEENVEKGYNAGIDAYQTKLDKESLLKTIHALLSPGFVHQKMEPQVA